MVLNHAGLWKAWFMRMMEGELLPKKPAEPSEDHIQAGQKVPYTPAEMVKRTEAYKVKLATWEQSNQVNNTLNSALLTNVI
jgi:hypothetical protein